MSASEWWVLVACLELPCSCDCLCGQQFKSRLKYLKAWCLGEGLPGMEDKVEPESGALGVPQSEASQTGRDSWQGQEVKEIGHLQQTKAVQGRGSGCREMDHTAGGQEGHLSGGLEIKNPGLDRSLACVLLNPSPPFSQLCLVSQGLLPHTACLRLPYSLASS